jgi:hypothetical protein
MTVEAATKTPSSTANLSATGSPRGMPKRPAPCPGSPRSWATGGPTCWLNKQPSILHRVELHSPKVHLVSQVQPRSGVATTAPTCSPTATGAVEHFTTNTSATQNLGSGWDVAYTGAVAATSTPMATQAVSTLVGGKAFGRAQCWFYVGDRYADRHRSRSAKSTRGPSHRHLPRFVGADGQHRHTRPRRCQVADRLQTRHRRRRQVLADHLTRTRGSSCPTSSAVCKPCCGKRKSPSHGSRPTKSRWP